MTILLQGNYEGDFELFHFPGPFYATAKSCFVLPIVQTSPLNDGQKYLNTETIFIHWVA